MFLIQIMCFCLSMFMFVGCSNGFSADIPDNSDTTDTEDGEDPVTPSLSKCVSVSELLELAERIRAALPKSLVSFSSEPLPELLCACPVPDTTVPVEEVPVEEVPDTTVPVEEVPVDEVPDTTVPVEDVPDTTVPVEEVPVEEVPVEEVPVEDDGVCPAGFVPRPSWYTGKL